MSVHILYKYIVYGFGAGRFLHEFVVQTYERQLFDIDVEIAEGNVVYFHAFAFFAVF